MKAIPWIVFASLALSQRAHAGEEIYVEFLWEPEPTGSIARQQTIQFLTDGKHKHQVCVAATRDDTDVGGLVLIVNDASGREVSSHSYADYRGIKKCYDADLGKDGRPGLWTFRAKTGNGQVGEGTLQVHARLQDSPLSKQLGVPYVAGRPNYDPSIPPQEWQGRLVWDMTVDADGRVTNVSVVTAEGVGAKLRDRAIAAGYLSLFFPDEMRKSKPLVWQRELSFAPE